MALSTQTSQAIEKIISDTIAAEGGYVNNPDDKGGETNWGITVATARRNGYTRDMRGMTRVEAANIYRGEFLVSPGFDKLVTISAAIAAELFDTGVNMGTVYPRLWLQQCLNALNGRATLYPDLKEDGQIGPATRSALTKFLTARGNRNESEAVLLKALNCLQGARYLELSRSREANESFTYGWLRARVVL